MAPSGKRFAPRDFLSIIDSVEEAVPFAIEGLAKADPDDPNVVLFEPTKTCNRWLRLPLSIVESIEPISRYQCGDHSHPVVRLVFSPPTTPEAAAFAALAGYLEEMVSVLATRAGARLETLPPDGGDAGAFPTACWEECDRKHPNDWRQRWVCKLFC